MEGILCCTVQVQSFGKGMLVWWNGLCTAQKRQLWRYRWQSNLGEPFQELAGSCEPLLWAAFPFLIVVSWLTYTLQLLHSCTLEKFLSLLQQKLLMQLAWKGTFWNVLKMSWWVMDIKSDHLAQVYLTAWALSEIQKVLKPSPAVLFLMLFSTALMSPLVAVGLRSVQSCSCFKHR